VYIFVSIDDLNKYLLVIKYITKNSLFLKSAIHDWLEVFAVLLWFGKISVVVQPFA